MAVIPPRLPVPEPIIDFNGAGLNMGLYISPPRPQRAAVLANVANLQQATEDLCAQFRLFDWNPRGILTPQATVNFSESVRVFSRLMNGVQDVNNQCLFRVIDTFVKEALGQTIPYLAAEIEELEGTGRDPAREGVLALQLGQNTVKLDYVNRVNISPVTRIWAESAQAAFGFFERKMDPQLIHGRIRISAEDQAANNSIRGLVLRFATMVPEERRDQDVAHQLRRRAAGERPRRNPADLARGFRNMQNNAPANQFQIHELDFNEPETPFQRPPRVPRRNDRRS